MNETIRPVSRPVWISWVETAGVTGFVTLFLLEAHRVAIGVDTAGDALVLALAMAFGYLLSDFASGCAHWFCDKFFEEDTPFLGRFVIHSFREHHRDPLAITRHGFIELNGNNCLVLIPVLAGAFWGDDDTGATSGLGLFTHVAVSTLAFAIFATNQFHRWAHDTTVPAWVGWMQNRGWILSKAHHDGHHVSPHEERYCITTGWLNGPLDRMGFFAYMERALTALGVPLSRNRVTLAPWRVPKVT